MTSHLKIQIFSDIFDFFLMYKQKESYIIQTNLFILYIHSFLILHNNLKSKSFVPEHLHFHKIRKRGKTGTKL